LALLTPSGVGWIYYVLLDDRLLIWVGKDRTLHHVEVPVDARQVSASVAELVRMLEQNYSSTHLVPRLKRLHDLILAPVEREIAGAETLIILPDKILNLVPFAALVDRATGRFLAQDHAVGISPSATLLLGDGDPSAARPSAFLDALIVGNPTLGEVDRGWAGDLEGAEAEARHLRGLYRRSTLLTGAEATSGRFVAEFGRYSVVHFAGHAVADAVHPARSRLYFAAESSSKELSGYLFAPDLAALAPGRTRLVVLAACTTAGDYISPTEGAVGLARPLLGIGIPTVAATLWRIDDVATPEFFRSFHESFSESGDALRALHVAQRRAIQGESGAETSPAVWAAVQLFIGRYEGGEGARI
jgi:CHAT domain-containing protein